MPQPLWKHGDASMVRIRLKGINTVSKRTRTGAIRKYYYHRASGQSVGKAAPVRRGGQG